jgi:hypothetical protein
MDVIGVASELRCAASLAIRGAVATPGSLAIRGSVAVRAVAVRAVAVRAVAVRAVAVRAVHQATLMSVVTPGTFHPTANALPGGSTLLALINGIAGWAVLFALAGLVIGAALWAIGSHSQNYQQSYVGRRAVLVSGIAALLIGAAPTLINFFFNTGHHIVNPLPQ